MPVVRNNEVSIGKNGTIHKLIVVRIFIYKWYANARMQC